MNNNALIVHSSGRNKDSVTRRITGEVAAQLKAQHPELVVKERDLAQGMPFVNEQWIGANFTSAEQRSAEQHVALEQSDALVSELQMADWLIIGSPIYNFSVPAVLKAWVDQVARAKLTFRYTEQGPEGLLKNKKALLVMASGGVTIGSEMDFATPYLQQMMGFLGIKDVQVLDANNFDPKRINHTLMNLETTSDSAKLTGAQYG